MSHRRKPGETRGRYRKPVRGRNEELVPRMIRKRIGKTRLRKGRAHRRGGVRGFLERNRRLCREIGEDFHSKCRRKVPPPSENVRRQIPQRRQSMNHRRPALFGTRRQDAETGKDSPIIEKIPFLNGTSRMVFERVQIRRYGTTDFRKGRAPGRSVFGKVLEGIRAVRKIPRQTRRGDNRMKHPLHAKRVRRARNVSRASDMSQRHVPMVLSARRGKRRAL